MNYILAEGLQAFFSLLSLSLLCERSAADDLDRLCLCAISFEKSHNFGFRSLLGLYLPFSFIIIEGGKQCKRQLKFPLSLCFATPCFNFAALCFKSSQVRCIEGLLELRLLLVVRPLDVAGNYIYIEIDCTFYGLGSSCHGRAILGFFCRVIICLSRYINRASIFTLDAGAPNLNLLVTSLTTANIRFI